MSPLTKSQWKSVLLNSVFAFCASFAPALAYSDKLNKAALLSAFTAGAMASLKVIEKSFKTE